jgi:hypothetical protein
MVGVAVGVAAVEVVPDVEVEILLGVLVEVVRYDP